MVKYTKWTDEEKQRLLHLYHQGKTCKEIAKYMNKTVDSVYQNLARKCLKPNKKVRPIKQKTDDYEPRIPKRETVQLVPMKEDDTPTYFANPIREELIDSSELLPERYKESRIYKLIHNKQ